MELRCPTLADVEKVRQWRNQLMEIHRTPMMLTEEMQEKFYHEVVCNRDAKSRWWAFYSRDNLVGFGGLLNIEWENGLAEVSLILSPQARGKGYGEAAVEMLLAEGFDNMGLLTIYGECYECNAERWGFWQKLVEKYGGHATTIPRRKRWQGKLYDSLHFSFWR